MLLLTCLLRSQKLATLAVVALCVCACPDVQAADDVSPIDAIEHHLNAVLAATPSGVDELTLSKSKQLAISAGGLHQAVGDVIFDRRSSDASDWLATTERLLIVKSRVDVALEQTLALRRELGGTDDDHDQRVTIRKFLQATTTLIDLSGRLRYSLREAVRTTAHLCATERDNRLKLIALLIENESGIGAGAMSALLEDPREESDSKSVDDFVKGKVLVLIATTQESDLLPHVARLALDETTSPSLTVLAVECIRRLGLPQTPHPRQDKTIAPPPVTARPLHERLSAIDTTSLSPRSAAHRQTLLQWLETRIAKGVTEDSFRFFGHEVRAGDWFLMRNPSPYNRFTDLSPGLFTHVGVVTTDVDEHGVRRFVIVDLPERGATIPVTNVDAYLPGTLHYFFLRHLDEDVAERMGEAARAMIGNPTQFDLNFDTSRVADYREGELRGRKIHTYCAGFLLICAQRSGAPVEDFFPLREHSATGNTQANLKTLGLSIGEDFVSPTAALFSPKLEVVGRRRPMYDPAREVQEAVYDHFAEQMQYATLHPSPDAAQALREKLARMSQHNAWLRRALASASGVSEQIDLVSAAKAAAVVETLDEIAETNRQAYLRTTAAFYTGAADDGDENVHQIRRDHHDLYKAWTDRELRPHQLQRRLVDYYARRGRDQLDARFFTSP